MRAEFCDDGISASRYGKDRPAWAALKAELRHGDVLVVWESSRAGRDLAEHVALRDLCTETNVPLSYSGLASARADLIRLSKVIPLVDPKPDRDGAAVDYFIDEMLA